MRKALLATLFLNTTLLAHAAEDRFRTMAEQADQAIRLNIASCGLSMVPVDQLQQKFRVPADEAVVAANGKVIGLFFRLSTIFNEIMVYQNVWGTNRYKTSFSPINLHFYAPRHWYDSYRRVRRWVEEVQVAGVTPTNTSSGVSYTYSCTAFQVSDYKGFKSCVVRHYIDLLTSDLCNARR